MNRSVLTWLTSQRQVEKQGTEILSRLTSYQKSLAEAALSGIDFEHCTYVMDVQIALLEMLEAFDKAETMDNDETHSSLQLYADCKYQEQNRQFGSSDAGQTSYFILTWWSIWIRRKVYFRTSIYSKSYVLGHEANSLGHHHIYQVSIIGIIHRSFFIMKPSFHRKSSSQPKVQVLAHISFYKGWSRCNYLLWLVYFINEVCPTKQNRFIDFCVSLKARRSPSRPRY